MCTFEIKYISHATNTELKQECVCLGYLFGYLPSKHLIRLSLKPEGTFIAWLNQWFNIESSQDQSSLSLQTQKH